MKNIEAGNARPIAAERARSPLLPGIQINSNKPAVELFGVVVGL